MENIKIIDNFLEKEELMKVEEFIHSKKFHYGHRSGDGSRDRVLNDFFSIQITEELFTKKIKEKIENIVSKKLEVRRLYNHIQTFGLDGCYHTDTEERRVGKECRSRWSPYH